MYLANTDSFVMPASREIIIYNFIILLAFNSQSLYNAYS